MLKSQKVLVCAATVAAATLLRLFLVPDPDIRWPFLFFMVLAFGWGYFAGYRWGLINAAMGFVADMMVFLNQQTQTSRQPSFAVSAAVLLVLSVAIGHVLGYKRRSLEQQREILLERERKARLEAEEANRVKDEFLATLSHELLTPLTSIKGWSRILRKNGTLKPATIVRAINSIDHSCDNLLHVIEDLLDTSRIKSGKLICHPEELDPEPVVRHAIEALHHRTEERGLNIEFYPELETCCVMFDPIRFRQVITNLLTNAIKFSQPGGTITVRVRNQGQTVVITVSDYGVGISPEFLPHIFDRFRQADSSSTRPSNGLGLGLSIVKHLIEDHNGEITAESPGPNQGAKFTIRLPRVTPTRMPA